MTMVLSVRMSLLVCQLLVDTSHQVTPRPDFVVRDAIAFHAPLILVSNSSGERTAVLLCGPQPPASVQNDMESLTLDGSLCVAAYWGESPGPYAPAHSCIWDEQKYHSQIVDYVERAKCYISASRHSEAVFYIEQCESACTFIANDAITFLRRFAPRDLLSACRECASEGGLQIGRVKALRPKSPMIPYLVTASLSSDKAFAWIRGEVMHVLAKPDLLHREYLVALLVASLYTHPERGEDLLVHILSLRSLFPHSELDVIYALEIVAREKTVDIEPLFAAACDGSREGDLYGDILLEVELRQTGRVSWQRAIRYAHHANGSPTIMRRIGRVFGASLGLVEFLGVPSAKRRGLPIRSRSAFLKGLAQGMTQGRDLRPQPSAAW